MLETSLRDIVTLTVRFMTSSHAVYPVCKKPPSKKNFKENVPTYFGYTGGEFTMIQMDANTRMLGKERRDMGYSLHNNSALFRGRFLLLFFVNG